MSKHNDESSVRVQLQTTESSLASSNGTRRTASDRWLIKFLEWAGGAGFKLASKENSESSSTDLANLCHSEEFVESGNCQLHNHTFSATVHTSRMSPLNPASHCPWDSGTANTKCYQDQACQQRKKNSGNTVSASWYSCPPSKSSMRVSLWRTLGLT